MENSKLLTRVLEYAERVCSGEEQHADAVMIGFLMLKAAAEQNATEFSEEEKNELTLAWDTLVHKGATPKKCKDYYNFVMGDAFGDTARVPYSALKRDMGDMLFFSDKDCCDASLMVSALLDNLTDAMRTYLFAEADATVCADNAEEAAPDTSEETDDTKAEATADLMAQILALRGEKKDEAPAVDETAAEGAEETAHAVTDDSTEEEAALSEELLTLVDELIEKAIAEDTADADATACADTADADATPEADTADADATVCADDAEEAATDTAEETDDTKAETTADLMAQILALRGEKKDEAPAVDETAAEGAEEAAEDEAEAKDDAEETEAKDDAEAAEEKKPARRRPPVIDVPPVSDKLSSDIDALRKGGKPAPTETQEDGGDHIDWDDLFGDIPKQPTAPTPVPDPLEGKTGPERLSALMGEVKRVRNELLDTVFGQDAAVNSVVSGYFQAALDSWVRKDRQRPKATFLFAGPPGVGKTFLAETAAKSLGLPCARFDMSEYADKEANIEFCGSDKVYKNAKAGNVTSFVAEHPVSILLFDEIEKAHPVVIYLFLQLLDAGRLRDNYTDKEVSFRDTIIIFTTNAGRNLYDTTEAPLSTLTRKRILKALSTDRNPMTGEPLFPPAICSRLASGNIVMFDRLGANHLFRIVARELADNVACFENETGVQISYEESIISSIVFAEGGKIDARAAKGRTNLFFHEEMYELLRLLGDDEAIGRLKKINFRVAIPQSGEVSMLFGTGEKPAILALTELPLAEKLQSDAFTLYTATSLAEAKEVMLNHDIALVLCDVRCAPRAGASYLNLEDIDSDGMDFLNHVVERYDVPVFLLEQKEGDISEEERLSFVRLGIHGIVTAHLSAEELCATVADKIEVSIQTNRLTGLAKASKVLRYKTAQTLSENGEEASISLVSLSLALAPDAEDEKALTATVSKPNLRFSDVIGAADAKEELRYFVEYLKNPVAFMRKGVKAPKGVLLYGPPGTGKTMLAKAMAGESDVTFLVAEGNAFLKKYVGEGPEALHKLFATARKYAPAILFIDEIDAIAQNRNMENNHSSDVLTALLTEMDGFSTDTSKPVFVLAATNYTVSEDSDRSLDPAMLRRFDRRIMVDLPTKEERKQYIHLIADKTPALSLSEEQIENIAVRSTGMSLALLEQVIELALRCAIRSENNIVDDAAFEEAFETYQSGEKKKWNDTLLERVARHEAGHALVCYLTGECPSYLTVVARAEHGGYMQHGDAEDKQILSRADLLNRICTSLGGRAAELACYGPEGGITTGASGDLAAATRTARQMICVYGMDDTLGLAVMMEALSASEGELRARVNAILKEQLTRAVSLIEDNRPAFDALVSALVERNRLNGDEIEAIMQANLKK